MARAGVASCDNDIIADQPGLAQVESEDKASRVSRLYCCCQNWGPQTSRYLYLLFVLVLTAHDWQQILILVVREYEYEYFTLLWILYGNMVDFSFIVSLYVSDLPNVTISTLPSY